jgi:hypothetical protein
VQRRTLWRRACSSAPAFRPSRPPSSWCVALAQVPSPVPRLTCVCARAHAQGTVQDSRSVAVPPHRFTPLKDQWLKVYTPLVEQMKLQVRMNLRSRRVEIRVRPRYTRPTRGARLHQRAPCPLPRSWLKIPSVAASNL